MNFINKIINSISKHLVKYDVPMDISYIFSFGFVSGIIFAIQIITGLIMLNYYDPNSVNSFDSIETMTRDVPFGWFLRSVHANSASFLFIACTFTYLRIWHFDLTKRG
jgi:ubiquinol-cytochrome c reductase cytochrome b subunit